MKDSKRKICEQLNQGDLDGSPEFLLETAIDCFGNELKMFALRRCPTESSSEDALQEAYIAALRYIDGFRGDTALRNWLYRLVSTACTRFRRGKRNDHTIHREFDDMLHIETSIPEFATAEPSAETITHISQRMEQLQELLEGISAVDRDLILQHEGDGVPLEQLAEEHGLSIPAIKSRLFRSRNKLRDAFAKFDDGIHPSP